MQYSDKPGVYQIRRVTPANKKKFKIQWQIILYQITKFFIRMKAIFHLVISALIILFSCAQKQSQPIDRYALVTRHNIVITKPDSLSPLTIGNGEFAFTADFTGLQTFPEFYEKGIPLGTQSQWGWHYFPNPADYTLHDVLKYFRVGNDSIPYAYQHTLNQDDRKNRASQWLRENPHRLHLGLIGFELIKNDYTIASVSDIQNLSQSLNLWTGELKSRFEYEGTTVEIITFCHQQKDMISCRIVSDLLHTGKIKIKISFPYGTHEKFSSAYNFSQPDRHTTTILGSDSGSVQFMRQLDKERYYMQLQWSNSARMEQKCSHVYCIVPSAVDSIFEISCLFSADYNKDKLPTFLMTRQNNRKYWSEFWKSGAAVDFSACTDPRAFELERRVILSQYLTKIQCTGSLPPQETGLTYNSWHGKFHMEMHWWHTMHFILWGRPSLMEKQLNYYDRIFDKAEKTAQLQGYKGVRWPKMVGPDGRESPSGIGPFLIWQQPHIIYLAEMLYQVYHHDKSVMNKYKKLVFATADFMASYARYDSKHNRYVLGPALIPAQERFNPETTINPPFELAYWYWGLQTAQLWKKRLGMKPDKQWQDVIEKLSDLPVADSLYLFAESAPDCYTQPKYLTDHPIVLGILGFLPETKKINRQILANTMKKIDQLWQWETIWGWDTPLAAMTATKLNQPEKAIDFLLMDTPKNRYLINGHNYQTGILTVYLPGNGAFLSAVAMMCTHKSENGNSGFPDNGKWNIKCENFPVFSFESYK